MRTIFFVIFVFGNSLCVCSQSKETKLEITRLTGDFYVYTTYNYYNGNRIPANGLYLVTDDGVVMIDSPWDTTQFQPLLDSIRHRHKRKVVMCIATHFHEDRTGGLAYYREKGIKTYTTRLTDSLSTQRGMKRAAYLIEKDTTFSIGKYSFQSFYPGPGHAPDNIVIWFEREKLLYGGCLIKSLEDNTLGNLGDANKAMYATTVRNVKTKCGTAVYVIPGHNDWTDPGSIDHTLQMAETLE